MIQRKPERYGMPYMGSKSRIADDIMNVLPRAETFVDLFAGGCAMTHAAMLSGKFQRYIINDISDVPSLFSRAILGGLKGENRWISRDDFYALKESDPYIRLCWSFGNNQRDYIYSREIEPYKRAYHYAVFFSDYEPMKAYGMDWSELDSVGGGYSERRLYVRRCIIPRYLKMEKLKIDVPSPERLQSMERLEQIQSFRGLVGLQSAEKFCRLESLERLEGLMQLCRPTDLQHAERIERLQGLQGVQGLQSLITLRGDYRDVEIPADACVYADPPYADSQKYGSEKREDFDIDGFWQWCRERPFPVFVSEYAAPDDFRSLYSVALNSTLSATNNARKRLEHLFVHERFYDEMQWLVPRQQLLF